MIPVLAVSSRCTCITWGGHVTADHGVGQRELASTDRGQVLRHVARRPLGGDDLERSPATDTPTTVDEAEVVGPAQAGEVTGIGVRASQLARGLNSHHDMHVQRSTALVLPGAADNGHLEAVPDGGLPCGSVQPPPPLRRSEIPVRHDTWRRKTL